MNEVPLLQGGLIHFVPQQQEFKRGDVDTDGNATIADAINLLSHLFNGGSEPQCMDAADVNDDGSISIADPVALLGFLFAGSSPPPAPGLDTCGSDPTADTLGCEIYNCQ